MSDRLTRESTLVLVVDWQERLAAAMPEALRDVALGRARTLVDLAADLSIPVLRTEQYPKGLGPTVEALRGPATFEKLTFSALGAPAFSAALAEAGRRNVVLVGMETHICVAQTARDLVAAGYRAWVVADACLSRRTLDWRLGCDRLRDEGVRIVTLEAAGFELLGAAGTPEFKAFSQRIR